MRTRRPRSSSSPLRRAAYLGLVAAVASAFVAVDPVRGVGESAADIAASAWTDVFGERPRASVGQRVIVVLRAPSLADYLAAAKGAPTPEEQKRWVTEADAGQRLLIARLASRGVVVRRDRSFTRTLNGFSALVDARALAELERLDYPPELVRAVASHADFLGVSRESRMEKTLYAVDELSGFIAACAYVRPQGIHGLTPKSVKKKLKQPSFAAAVNRDDIRHGVEELGVDLDEHIAFVIAALEERADELELHGSAGATA